MREEPFEVAVDPTCALGLVCIDALGASLPEIDVPAAFFAESGERRT